LYAGFTVVIVEAPTLIVVLLFWLIIMTYVHANQHTASVIDEGTTYYRFWTEISVRCSGGTRFTLRRRLWP